MNKKFLFICLVTILGFITMAQPGWQWAKNPQCINSDNSNSIITDVSGNVLVTGFFFGSSITFGSYTLTNSGNYDTYVVKYDPSGNVLWAKSSGGQYDDVGCSIATDISGNIYVSGYFYSPLISFGTFSLTNSGAGDNFLVKYDPSGNELWAKSSGAGGDENALSVTTDPAGNVCMTGYFQSASLVIDSYTLSGAGNNDIFIIKYNPSGTVLWAASAGGSGNDTGRGITTDSNGSIYITGFFYSPALTIGTATLNSYGSSDAFIAKYDSLGNPLWADKCGGGFNDAAYAITCDVAGNVYITGGYLSSNFSVGSYTFSNSGGFDLFITKFSNSGNILWAKKAAGGQDDIGYGISSDAAANIYITGHFHSPSITFGGTVLNNSGIGDMFLAKSDSSGNMLWAEAAGGTTDDGGSSVACDIAGNVYVTGYFFSSSISFSNTTLTNNGSDDMFIAKYQPLTTSYEKLSSVIDISFFPNPSNGLYQSIVPTNSVRDVCVKTINGSVVPCKVVYSNEQIIIDLSGKLPGLYFATINTSFGLVIKKLTLIN